MSLTRILQASLAYDNVFERVLDYLERETTTDKGRLWEEFCQRYLQAEGYEQVWLLTEFPEAELLKLGLRRQDMGIDIIVKHQGRYRAVQCKYRKRQSRDRKRIEVRGAPTTSNGIHGLGGTRTVTIPLNRVGWKELATFYALCARTQPTAQWEKLVVMTTANSVRRQGDKTAQDQTYAYRGFEVTDRTIWLKMAGSTGNVLNVVTTVTTLTPQELREVRARFYTQ